MINKLILALILAVIMSGSIAIFSASAGNDNSQGNDDSQGDDIESLCPPGGCIQ